MAKFRANEKQSREPIPLFDERFLRRLERLSYRSSPLLRGVQLGERRSKRLRPSPDFSDHRPYAPGDDLRNVDWHAFGKHEDLFVKLGETTQNINLHILLDRSRSMAWEGPKNRADKNVTSKWDMARYLAGALAYLGLAGGERVTITPFTNKLNEENFGPTEGKRQVIPALRYLATTTPAPPPKTPNPELLAYNLKRYAMMHANMGGMMVLISDLLDATPPDEIEEAGRWLSEGLRHYYPPRWQVIVLHLLTEDEWNPDLRGSYDLEDMETGEKMSVNVDKAMLETYRTRVRRWSSGIQSACEQRAATYGRVMAEWPLEKQVIPYLQMRGVVQ